MIRRSDHHFYDKPWFWDAMIALLLIGSAFVTFLSLQAVDDVSHPLARIALLALIIVMVIGFGLTFYGSFVEPKRLVVRKENIMIPNAPRLRIVMASDFHVGPYKGKAFMQKVVEAINAQNPDMIFLLGDFIDTERSSLEDLEPLKYLKATHGIFAIVGNHDAGHYLTLDRTPYVTVDRTEDVKSVLEAMNITFLRNEHRLLTLDHGTICIAGTDDSFMKSCSLIDTFKHIHIDTPIILLSHNPDIINDHLYQRSDVILSGHTHGGQIRLPFIGPLGPMPTRIARRIDQGWFTLKSKTKLFITHGCGETWARARLFCPPEIVVLEVNGKV